MRNSRPHPGAFSNLCAAVVLVLGLAITASSASAQATGTIRGRVIADGSMRPLVGAQVTVQGTSRGALTNQNGDFVITTVPAGSHSVQAQMIGYGSEEMPAAVSAGGAAQLDFTLAQQALALDELVVTGTVGQARRREVGNSISQISMSNVIEPIQTAESLLQGRAPGVRVTFTDASVGSGAAIRLRGSVSASQSNQPLIYIDGVRQSADSYRAGGNSKAASPLADINPNDIDRIEIIKGAAAATLYGSEAAAGVIQVFTKRGSDGDPRFTYQTDQSAAWVRPWGSEQRPKLNLDPWLRTGYGQTHLLSVTGGGSSVRYFVSGNYTDREGAQIDDHENRYGIRSNVTISATEKLSFDVNSMFTSHVFETMPAGNNNNSIFFQAYRAPNNLVGGALPGDPLYVEQINSLRSRTVDTNNQRAVVGLTANWTPLEALSSRFTLGYDRMGQDQMTVVPFGHPVVPLGSINTAAWHTESLTADFSASYQLDFGAFRTTSSGGGQLVKRSTEQLVGTGEGLPGPGNHTLNATATRNVTQTAQNVNTGGLFAQQMFEFRDRYFVTVGVRADGSSAFGQDFGLEIYPKVSGSYVVSDETFWPEMLGEMKLRAAYGFAGRAPGAFDAARTWTASSYLNQTAFTPSNIGNPTLGPERTGELEVGFDGAFVDNRVTLDFTYYNRHTTEALFNVGQAPSLGFGGSQLENVGELRSTGFEVATDVTVLNMPSLTWNVGADISTNKSEVLSTGGVVDYNTVVGQPVYVLRGAKILNPDEIADPIYELDAFIGPTDPTMMLGLSTSFQLPKGVTVSARGEYESGHFAREFASNLMAQRTGLGAMGCDHVYQIVPHDGSYVGPGGTHPNLGQLRAWDRALCYTRSRADAWNLRRDFAALREISIQAPVPFNIPGVSNAFVTGSVQNILRWVHPDFYSHDPESTGAADATTSLTGGNITDHIPAPATATISVRIGF